MLRQHAIPAPTRLLLPAAFTIVAGIGLALAFADEANAAEREPSTLVEQATVRASTSVDVQLPPPASKTTLGSRAVRPPAGHPREAPQRAERIERAVSEAADRAARTVERVGGLADEMTAPLPVVGKTVDRVTDRASEILDSAPTAMDRPLLPRPGELVDVIGCPDGDSAGVGDQPAPAAALSVAVPQTAPGPAREHPPLVTAGPDADLVRLADDSGGPAAGRAEDSRDARLTTDLPGFPDSPASSVSNLIAMASSHSDSHTCLPASRWSVMSSWQHAVVTYIADRDGRTEPPSPPSG